MLDLGLQGRFWVFIWLACMQVVVTVVQVDDCVLRSLSRCCGMSHGSSSGEVILSVPKGMLVLSVGMVQGSHTQSRRAALSLSCFLWQQHCRVMHYTRLGTDVMLPVGHSCHAQPHTCRHLATVLAVPAAVCRRAKGVSLFCL